MPLPESLAFATLGDLGRRWRAAEFTAVELAEFFLKRLDTIGRELGAVATLCRDLALEQARRADDERRAGRDRGPLHGMPVGVKDLLAVPGYPTTWGCEPYRERVLEGEATVVRRLREAGAVLVAKLAMIELAGGLGYRQANASWTGPARNPWKRTTWAGGSSSGSGAAVAAGCVPAAIGSETWGSILTPASYCGLTGFRPTYGLVSRAGAMALSWTMDKIGPMTRTVADAQAVLAVIAGHDPADDSSTAHGFLPPLETERGPFRIGLLRDPLERVRPDIKTNFDTAVEVLKGFGTVEPVSLPDFPYSAVASLIIASEMSAVYDPLVVNGDVWKLTAPEDRPGAHASRLIPAKDYIHALRIRHKAQKALDALFAKYDAIVAPATATTAIPIDGEFGSAQVGFRASGLGAAGNIAGLPCVMVPTGFDDDGLPTSMQLTGRAFADVRVAAVAGAYQSKTDWHTKTPPLDTKE
jgi:aspartyl-tRNA(Asn)/glutamyl-tRNA(Gln) amidotransferase subunit A